ncbi:MAG: hypothetical protein Q8M83_04055 [bacterium]|nr:hypothetical protein [bacterium]
MNNFNGNISEPQLKFGLWLVKYKPTFRFGLIVVLIVLSLGYWTYALYGFLDYVLFSSRGEKFLESSMVSESIDWARSRETNKPVDLFWDTPQTLSTRTGTDLLARIQNSNPNWLARFDYSLSAGDKVETGFDFVLPGTVKYLLTSFKEERGGVNFSITDVKWQRIDAREVAGDYAKFFGERLNFVFGEAKYVLPSRDLPGRAAFSVWNKGAFSFWQAKFLILVRRGQEIVGANTVTLEQLRSGDKKAVEINWFDNLGAFSGIEIITDINIFDKDVFMPPGA